jgi:hypothetical protein
MHIAMSAETLSCRLRCRLAGSPLVSIAFLAPASNKRLWKSSHVSFVGAGGVVLKIDNPGMSVRQIRVEGNGHTRRIFFRTE